jgi:hypothetical protein
MSVAGPLHVLVLALALGGCSGAISSPPPAVVDPSPTPMPTEPNDANARTACATQVWEGLIRAFNAGDASALERTIGSGPLALEAFQWVSFADGMGRDTEYSAEGARRMLLERWSRGQRLTLVSVRAGPGPSWHGGVDASVRLESRAPGVSGAAPILGKTVVSCLGARVMVVSLGDE